MTTATLTSKNQITIPVEIVRALKIGENRRMTVEKRGDEIVIKPEQDLLERLEKVWAKNSHLITRSYTDDELRQVKRDAWEYHIDQKMKRWKKQGLM